MKKTPLFIIFTTVFIDLVGFGIIVPLVANYGEHYQASGLALGFLAASYSLMQFFFAPLWGSLSDRYGRRPILLMSLAGSTLSYVGFAFADSFFLLVGTRIFAGIFAANISTAQAYIADITTPETRAKGMGMIGAAFGLGFLLGPWIGGETAHRWGLQAPGLIAAGICGLNFLLAGVRLPESLAPENKRSSAEGFHPLRGFQRIKTALTHQTLAPMYLMFFLFTFAMSNMEQVFSVFFKLKFDLGTTQAALQTGRILALAGIVGVLVQGGLIRKLVPRYGEVKVLLAGAIIFIPAALILPFGPAMSSYYWIIIPLGLGSGLITPSLTSLVSRSAAADLQGQTMGINQSIGSLARTIGPFVGLGCLELNLVAPFHIAAGAGILLLAIALGQASRLSALIHRA